MAAHVSVVTQRVSRKAWLRGAEGSRQTLCGAAITASDILLADARRMSTLDCQQFDVCAACIRELQRREVERMFREGR
jgi:hypothetical protein